MSDHVRRNFHNNLHFNVCPWPLGQCAGLLDDILLRQFLHLRSDFKSTDKVTVEWKYLNNLQIRGLHLEIRWSWTLDASDMSYLCMLKCGLAGFTSNRLPDARIRGFISFACRI